MKKKKNPMAKAEKLYDSIIDSFREIRKESTNYIKSVLEAHDNNIDFDDYDVDSYISVVYDGGNHPEYASNAFSTVNGVFINRRGVISLNTEDCSDYELADVSWEEVYNLAEYLKDEIFKDE